MINNTILNFKFKIRRLTALIAAAPIIVGAALVLMPRGTDNVEFVIQSGQTLNETAELLNDGGLVISPRLFVIYAALTGNEKKFKAGRYLLPPRSSIYSLVKTFSQGRAESEDIVVTIPEGTNVADIDKIFTSAGLTESGELLADALKYEGYLFPDTYHFKNLKSQISNLKSDFEDQNPKQQKEEIIKKMLDNFYAKTQDLFRGLSDDEVRSVVIIASMLEKEVKTEEDMRLVAGIMKKRQDIGMALEIDATVSYGVCLPKFVAGEYCDVSLANIVDNIPKDSAYNTYRRKGLPAGPISNPGLIALKAALNPQPSDYLYYLSAEDGTTVFSRTAQEHIRARQKFLK